MSGNGDKTLDTRKERGLALKERPRTRKPPMYKVLLHNDDYTTKEFVVMVLESIFHHNEADANRIMLHVHLTGVGVAGVYAYEVAETKASRTMKLAQQYEYPLVLSIEPDGSSDEA